MTEILMCEGAVNKGILQKKIYHGCSFREIPTLMEHTLLHTC